MIGLILFSPLTPIENILRDVLDWLHSSAGLPWAWAIVALTIIVRIALVPLTVRQIHSMQSMQAHMPEMKAIQQKYKHDKKRQQEELMKFYRENNINPAASCLPLLAQFPVFISLYLVLRHFAKHPPPGDLSWMHHFVPNIAAHASSHWSGFVLLAIYVVSQLLSTLLMATTMDKTQRTMLLVLPVAFVFFLVNFPTGLVLYWVTTNLWTVGQGLITRRLIPKTTSPLTSPFSRPKPDGDGGGRGAKAKPEPPKPRTPAKAAAPQQRVKRKKKARR